MRSMLRCIAAIFAATLLLVAAPVRAADPTAFTVEQLDQMLAPIALFPDALLAGADGRHLSVGRRASSRLGIRQPQSGG